MGNHQLAIKDFDRSLEIDTELSEGFYRRGVSKLACNRFHDAIDDFGRSEDFEKSDLDNRNAGIPDGLAQCNHALKDTELALIYYDKAIEMD